MSTVLTEQTTFGDWLIMEGEKRYSRDEVTLLSGKKYVSGEVLGIVTASGKHTSYNQDGADGTETAVAVLMNDVDATDADQPGVVIARHAQVLDGKYNSLLVWPTNLSYPGEKDAAVEDLKNVGIIVVNPFKPASPPPPPPF